MMKMRYTRLWGWLRVTSSKPTWRSLENHHFLHRRYINRFNWLEFSIVMLVFGGGGRFVYLGDCQDPGSQ